MVLLALSESASYRGGRFADVQNSQNHAREKVPKKMKLSSCRSAKVTSGLLFGLVAMAGLVFAIWAYSVRPKALQVGVAPPALRSSGQWLNSPEPVTWSSLRGKVVWLEFGFLH